MGSAKLGKQLQGGQCGAPFGQHTGGLCSICRMCVSSIPPPSSMVSLSLGLGPLDPFSPVTMPPVGPGLGCGILTLCIVFTILGNGFSFSLKSSSGK